MTKKKSDNFSGIFEALTKPLTNFFTNIIQNKVIEVKDKTLDALYNFKKQVFRGAVEIFLFLIGLAALIIGGAMYLSRFISLDIILIIAGLVVCLGVLFTAKLKR